MNKIELKTRILVSACLLGHPTRYDGRRIATVDRLLSQWQSRGLLIPVCPELAGGLPVPRPPAEIVGGSGIDVLNGHAVVRTAAGDDVTVQFVRGANATLRVARENTVTAAILKDGSPSCGKTRIYNGAFNGTVISGSGVTVALLHEKKIAVFSENETSALREFLGRVRIGAGANGDRNR